MNFELTKDNQIIETEGFKTFAEDIDYLTEFFSDLSELIFFNGRIITFFSVNECYLLNTALIKSSAQTLRNIKLCCSIGAFSDANTLIRKLRDDLIQYVYILNIINDRKPFLGESLKNFKTDSPEDFVKSLSNLQYNNNLTDDEQAVTAWFKNSVSDLPFRLKGKLGFKNYMIALKQNSKIAHILTEYKLHGYWKALSGTLNNYVHNNGTSFSSNNFISANNKDLETHLKNISTRTSYVSSFFLIVLLMIESSIISSTDYIDYLDCNMKPPEDSQFSIAVFVQDFIDKKVSKIHPELKQYLKDNNIQGMRID